MNDTELLDRLDAIWRGGVEEEGVEEGTGNRMFRRLAVLVAIRPIDGDYPDVRTLIADMPVPTSRILTS